MNRNTRTVLGTTLVMAVTALAVVSCGGGGNSFAGIDRLGVSSGSITGFGSIFVNGVEWNTSGATITVDDSPGTESQLKIGQVVTVRGTLHSDGTGDADSIDFDNAVEGPIASIDLATDSFVVLDQTVIVSADTEFDDSIPDRVADGQRQLNDLLAGVDIVEVSGYRDSTGAIRATHIEIGSAGGNFEVKGVVTSLNTGAFTFQIDGLVVNYAGATLEDFGSDTLSDGDYVEAKGSFASGILTASVVQREDSPTGESGEDSEVEGYITRFVSATDFDVAGVPVTTDGSTQFEGGTAANLALNVKVEVEGVANASGVIVADKVDIRIQPEEADVEIVGDVASVNAAAGTVTIAGVNVVVRTNEVTSFEDDSASPVPGFSLSSLNTGDHVRIRGAEDGSTAAVNDVIATRIERQVPEALVVLQGPVQAINEPDLSILGVQVATDFAVFRDHEEQILTDAEFFAIIGNAPRPVVKATAVSDNVIGGILLAGEVQIEELDD